MGWGAGTAAIESVELARRGWPRSAYAEQSPQGGGHAASSRRCPCRRADPGAARRPGRRPRRLVGEGGLPQEDAAVAEIIAAFEQKTGKQVELVHPAQEELPDKIQAALEAGQPPDFLFGNRGERWVAQWAYQDQLVDLAGALGPVLDLFDADTIEVSTLLDGKTGRRGLYALPMGRYSNHVHVWNSLLERAGFTLADIPKDGRRSGLSGATRCSRPCARRWAVTTSGAWGCPCRAAGDTDDELLQFELAYGTPWLDRDRRASDRRSRGAGGNGQSAQRLHGHLAQGLHAARVDELDQHRQQQGVSRPDRGDDAEPSLSIPGALRTARPDDYYKNAATIDWPDGADGQPLVIVGDVQSRRGLQGRRTRRSPRTSSASSPRKAGSPTGWISPAIATCRRCASWSTSRSGSTRATRTACVRRSRS